MRASVLLRPLDNSITTAYQKSLTAAVLRKIFLIDPGLAKAIHDVPVGKPFIHSRLLGCRYTGNGSFALPSLITLQVGWRSDVVDAFSMGVEKEPLWEIAGVKFETVGIDIEPTMRKMSFGRFVSVSSVLVSTLCEKGVRWLNYRKEPDLFVRELEASVRRRAEKAGQEGDIRITVRRCRPTAVRWGDLIFPANEGEFVLEGDLVRFVYETGLGRHPAMGFGMLAEAC